MYKHSNKTKPIVGPKENRIAPEKISRRSDLLPLRQEQRQEGYHQKNAQRSQIKTRRHIGAQNHQEVQTEAMRPLRKSKNESPTIPLLYANKWGKPPHKKYRMRKRRRRYKRVRRKPFADQFCLICVKKTKNNTHLAISRLFGDRKTLWTMSGGQTPSIGSKANGRRKSRYCQRMVFKAAIEKLHGLGLKYLVIHCIGQTLSKKYMFKNFFRRFRIVLVRDIRPIPHNGCRPRSVRRL